MKADGHTARDIAKYAQAVLVFQILQVIQRRLADVESHDFR